MPPISRRSLVKYLSITPMLMPTMVLADTRHSKFVRTIDISKYRMALLPREHGQLTHSDKTILRRYPSREHCMQMAAFLNDHEALVVIGNDPKAGISDWEIKVGRTLRIFYYDTAPEVLIIKTKPTLEAVASAYKEWSVNQFWVKNRIRNTKPLNFISVASSSSMEVERAHLDNVLDSVAGNIGIWFTQWRKYDFDRMYPDYTPKQPRQFSELVNELRNTNRVTTLPYINGLLWDKNNTKYKLGKKVSITDSDNDFVRYNRDLDFLYFACPSSTDWQYTIRDARNSVLDSRNRPSNGVYLDMLAASAPLLCWSTQHDHTPGDPYSWKDGIRTMLKQISGSIMIEGCAEVYNDLIDYPLMHLYTDQKDSIELWSLVYGDRLQSVGWKLTNDVTAKSFLKVNETVDAHHVKSLGSPWMTTTPESELLKRGLLKKTIRPESPSLKIGN